jgi:hypothetical protein
VDEDAARFRFAVYRDDEIKEATYDRSLILEASRVPAEDDLARLTLRMADGGIRVHLVMAKAAIFVCETIANRAR